MFVLDLGLRYGQKNARGGIAKKLNEFSRNTHPHNSTFCLTCIPVPLIKVPRNLPNLS